MVPPELNAPIGEQKPLTALAVCAMFERAGGESEDRPSSWGKNSAPESSGDPFLIGIIASTPDLTSPPVRRSLNQRATPSRSIAGAAAA
jgi:hypothetical protein